jgi:hypothetical protein
MSTPKLVKIGGSYVLSTMFSTCLPFSGFKNMCKRAKIKEMNNFGP